MLIRDDAADARMARSQGVLDYGWPLLRYPLRSASLPVVLMLALLLALSLSPANTTEGIPTGGLPLLLISLLLGVSYLIRIIDCTARGYATPPPMGGEALYFVGTLKPVAIPIMLSISLFALHSQHALLAQCLVAFVVFVAPAYLFIYATEENLSSALNPLRWFKVISVMGLAYLLPCLLLVLSAELLAHVAGHAGVAVLVALCCYLLFGTAHVLGYVGFKQQHALGLQVDVPDPDLTERKAAHAEQSKALLKQIHDLLLERDEASAVQAVTAHRGGPLDTLLFHEELFHKMQLQGTPLLLLVTGRKLITLLLAERLDARALDIAEHCLDGRAQFVPETPQQLESLLRQALRLRFEALYHRLLDSADADGHAQDPTWAGVQFLRAHHAAETLHDDALALTLLTPLRGMSQHPEHARFERFARTLEALLARNIV